MEAERRNGQIGFARFVKRLLAPYGALDGALRFALLGPPGSGVAEVSWEIERQIRSRKGSERDRHVRIDAGMLVGFDLAEAHAQIVNAVLSASFGSSRLSVSEREVGSSAEFVPYLRNLLSENDLRVYLYFDRLELLCRNISAALGNEFREFLESEYETKNRFHLIWSGTVSIFSMRTPESSALGMCEPVSFPIADADLCVEMCLNALSEAGFSLDPASFDMFQRATGGEPAFLHILIQEMRRAEFPAAVSSDQLIEACQELVRNHGRVVEFLRIGTAILTDDSLRVLCSRLLEQEQVTQTDQIVDIDRYQLSGALVARGGPGRRTFVFRNQLVENFCKLIIAVTNRRDRRRSASAISPTLSKAILKGPLRPMIELGRMTHKMSTVRGFEDYARTCWEGTIGVGRIAMVDVLVGDLSSGLYFAVDAANSDYKRLPVLSSLIEGDPHIDYVICRNKTIVFSERDKSIVAIGLRHRGVDCLVLTKVDRDSISRQFSEFELLAFSNLMRSREADIVESVLSGLGRSMIHQLGLSVSVASPSDEVKISGATAARGIAEVLFSRHETIVRIDGRTDVIPGCVRESWLRRISSDTLDLSRFFSNEIDYKRKIHDISESIADEFKREIPGLLPRLSLIPSGSFLRISHVADMLRLPIEFVKVDGDFLSFKVALFRHIIEAPSGNSFDVVIEALKIQGGAAREPFRAILVGAYIGEQLSRARAELDHLENVLTDWGRSRGVPIEIQRVEGLKATRPAIEMILSKSIRYHMLHFCGHAAYNADNPDASSLIMSDRNGAPEYISCRAVSNIFDRAKCSFVYLSCCYAGAIGDPDRTLSSDFSGIGQAVLSSGVPNVLCFRWEVSDCGAESYAKTFYNRLFGDLFAGIEEAARYARLKASETSQSFDAWASPILICNIR